MNKPHKHAALIKAWADGAEIQFRLEDSSGQAEDWETFSPGEAPSWLDDCEYRIKPKTIKYRNALVSGISGSKPYVLAIDEGADLTCFTHVKWLGDWQEVEV